MLRAIALSMVDMAYTGAQEKARVEKRTLRTGALGMTTYELYDTGVAVVQEHNNGHGDEWSGEGTSQVCKWGGRPLLF